MHERGYRYAISNPIYQLEPSFCSSLAFDALTYFYYSSMCALAVKKYEKAFTYLMDTVSMPCNDGISAVQIAALKKAKIAALLVENPEPFDIPRFLYILRISYL